MTLLRHAICTIRPMSKATFKANAYVKEGCPFSFKFLVFMAEASLLDEIEIVRLARRRCRLTRPTKQQARRASRQAGVVSDRRDRAGSLHDGLRPTHRALREAAKGYGPTSMPVLSLYKQGILPKLFELHKLKTAARRPKIRRRALSDRGRLARPRSRRRANLPHELLEPLQARLELREIGEAELQHVVAVRARAGSTPSRRARVRAAARASASACRWRACGLAPLGGRSSSVLTVCLDLAHRPAEPHDLASELALAAPDRAAAALARGPCRSCRRPSASLTSSARSSNRKKFVTDARDRPSAFAISSCVKSNSSMSRDIERA